MEGDKPSSESKLAHPDVVAGLVLIAACAAALGSTTTFREVPAMLSQNVPPTFFPRLILSVITILSLTLIVTARRRGRPRRDTIPPRVFLTAILLVGAALLVPRLGMLVTVVLVAVVLPFSWGERRPLRVVGLAFGLALAIHVVFVLGLGLRFPRGAFWEVWGG
ncbi:MAG TPA: tripartite tricarboxylate transporter TctB family protein [Vicinamibacteria bacterium]|nr:tripartite tricarboxylate transporter TctB family protein [Vicinamibacteria bacterium]